MLEPKQQVGLQNSTIEVFCFANVKNYNWTAVYLFYTKRSSTQRFVSVSSNGTSSDVGNSINTTILNGVEIVNISFVLSIREENLTCSSTMELTCSMEFNDSFIEPRNATGTVDIIGNYFLIYIIVRTSFRKNICHFYGHLGHSGDVLELIFARRHACISLTFLTSS